MGGIGGSAHRAVHERRRACAPPRLFARSRAARPICLLPAVAFVVAVILCRIAVVGGVPGAQGVRIHRAWLVAATPTRPTRILQGARAGAGAGRPGACGFDARAPARVPRMEGAWQLQRPATGGVFRPAAPRRAARRDPAGLRPSAPCAQCIAAPGGRGVYARQSSAAGARRVRRLQSRSRSATERGSGLYGSRPRAACLFSVGARRSLSRAADQHTAGRVTGVGGGGVGDVHLSMSRNQ